MLQMKVIDLNEIYISYHVIIFYTINHIWTSCKLLVVLDSYEVKENSPDKFSCILPVLRIAEIRQIFFEVKWTEKHSFPIMRKLHELYADYGQIFKKTRRIISALFYW